MARRITQTSAAEYAVFRQSIFAQTGVSPHGITA